MKTVDPLAIRRLFVPLAREPYDWFASGAKKFEVRRNHGPFSVGRLPVGRRAELRRGYQKTSSVLWGTITSTTVAPSIELLYRAIPAAEAIPTGQSLQELVAYTRSLLGDGYPQGVVAIQICLDSPGRNPQTLRFAPEYLELVRSGAKRTTIRLAPKSFVPGPIKLRFGDVVIDGAIVEARKAPFASLSDREAAADGFEDLRALTEALRGHYRSFSPNQDVTIVYFRIN